MAKWIGSACSCLLVLLAPPPLAFSQTQLPETVYIWPTGNVAQEAMMSSLAGVVNRTTNGEVLLSPDNGAQPNHASGWIG